MKNFKHLAISILLCICANSYSQILIINNANSGPNSAQTEALYKRVAEIQNSIVAALEIKDLKKAEYYVKYWGDELGPTTTHNVNWWVLRAQLYEMQGRYKLSKRCYSKAYEKFGCYECKDRMDKLPKN